jgi:hypothetical protein
MATEFTSGCGRTRLRRNALAWAIFQRSDTSDPPALFTVVRPWRRQGLSIARKLASNGVNRRGKTRFAFAPDQLVIRVTREECMPQVG